MPFVTREFDAHAQLDVARDFGGLRIVGYYEPLRPVGHFGKHRSGTAPVAVAA